VLAHIATTIRKIRQRFFQRERMTICIEDARAAASLPEELDLHSLRHSYVTHLMEFDYPERFVQDQVGHSYASTTSIYSHVSDEYRNRLVVGALTKRGIAFEKEPG
jgi:site-specific recombinase XerD